MSIYTLVIEAATGHYELECPTFFEAEYMAALAQAGKYMDDVLETFITVDCPIHGYSLTLDGDCDACYDDHMQALYDELLPLDSVAV